MTALEQSLQFGNRECHQWRGEIFDALPTFAEDLAGGFVYVAERHGNAAGNRWLRRNVQGLMDPAPIYRRFMSIGTDLKRAVGSIQQRGATTIEGIRSASDWLADIERRLIVGSLNATHDDEALVDYAQAQAQAVDKLHSRGIGDIAKFNRRQRLGLLPPPPPRAAAQGASLSEQYRRFEIASIRARNPLTPPVQAGCYINLVLLRFTYCRPLSLAVIQAQAIEHGRARAALHGIAPPSDKTPAKSQLGRLSCSLWWRRKLRRQCGRAVEQVLRESYRVHAQAGIYCSDVTIERRRAQQVRNNALLETLEAINQEGQVFTLAELAEKGLANPDHRRAELMLRISDTEAEARRLGHCGMFYTMTTPSKFHPVIANKIWDAKQKRYRYQCRRNPKYQGATPREAQKYLQGLWAKIRAKLARDDIGVYGIRVVEPHHDGTPHWHLLLWMRPESEAAITAVMREYAEEAHPEELFNRWGKTTARFDAKRIDYKKGTAAGYVAKYISKNINGEQFTRDGVKGDSQDRYGHELDSTAPRIEAWASVWGIRQFQFMGLPSVTVWREVRRLTEKQEQTLKDWEAATRPHPCAAMRFAQIRKAANAGQWDQFLRLMGGPMTKRRDQPVKPWTETKMNTGSHIEKFSPATGEHYGSEAIVAKGRYGEEQTVTFGVVATGRPGRESEYMTRVYKWQVRAKGSAAGVDLQAEGEAESPWTRVTNCTQIDITPPDLTPAELAEQRERLEEWQKSDFYRADMEDAYREAADAREAAHRLFVSPPPSAEIWEDEFFPAGI